MPILDDFSGFEFEDLMEDVFRNLGYVNVRQSKRTGDEGRDILMEEVVEGERRAVVVECKHKDTVSRPVVQKLHSAVTTYDFAGPKRGIVVTTGRFTQPARDYTQKVAGNGGGITIDLIDGTDLRDIAEAIGLDLYNGRIEILCDETLRPFDPTSSVDAPLRAAFRDVENINASDVPAPQTHATFHPYVKVEAATDAVFETSVGVVHRIDDQNTFVIYAGGESPQFPDETVGQLVSDNFRRTIDLDEDEIGQHFDSMDVGRFGQTETGYKEWAVDRIRRLKTTTVHYTGDNNVDYEKTCEPKQSDVSVQTIDAVYLPLVRLTATLGEYEYPYEHYAAGPSRVTTEDGVRQCVHCGDDGTLTYCANCGSVNCGSHTKTERLEQEPICTGCAVTERFAFRTKYFYDDGNLASFREEYEAMPVYEKAMENQPAVAASVLVFVLGVLGLLLGSGLL